MINPIITATIAMINTAPAAKSFVCLMDSLYSGETKSDMASIAELIASAEKTAPIIIIMEIHSVVDKLKIKPAGITQIVIAQ